MKSLVTDFCLTSFTFCTRFLVTKDFFFCQKLSNSISSITRRKMLWKQSCWKLFPISRAHFITFNSLSELFFFLLSQDKVLFSQLVTIHFVSWCSFDHNWKVFLFPSDTEVHWYVHGREKLLLSLSLERKIWVRYQWKRVCFCESTGGFSFMICAGVRYYHKSYNNWKAYKLPVEKSENWESRKFTASPRLFSQISIWTHRKEINVDLMEHCRGKRVNGKSKFAVSRSYQ